MLKRGAPFYLAFLLGFPALAALPFTPRDDSPTHPDFESFRQSFLSAMARGDLSYLESSARLPAQGKALFRTNDVDKLTRRLKAMQKAVRLGCVYKENPAPVFVCSYVYALWPRDRQAASTVWLVQDGVNLRQGPVATAVRVGTLNRGFYSLCKINQLGQDTSSYRGFFCLKAGPNGQGFVSQDLVASPKDPWVKFVLRPNLQGGSHWAWEAVFP